MAAHLGVTFLYDEPPATRFTVPAEALRLAHLRATWLLIRRTLAIDLEAMLVAYRLDELEALVTAVDGVARALASQEGWNRRRARCLPLMDRPSRGLLG